MKKYRRSAFTYVCYAAAALFAVYALYIVYGTLASINEYRVVYGMEFKFLEIMSYILQGVLQPCIYMLFSFMAGLLLDEVRKLNQAYWLTDEEIAAAKEEKKRAKAEAALARSEAAEEADKAVAEVIASGAEAAAEAAGKAEDAAETEKDAE